jgi:transposase
MKETQTMVTFGIDAHKHTHTVVAVDEVGRELATRTFATTTAAHLELLGWAQELAGVRVWAVEDCRHVSRRLERDLLGAGERIVRVPPKLMAGSRKAARSYGKSDPIDALAVARAALREPGLPTARLDGPERELRLLVDHRDDLVAERTRIIARLRWHLHELDPAWAPPPRSLDRAATWRAVEAHLDGLTGRGDVSPVVVRIAGNLIARCRALTIDINALTVEITTLVTPLAPALLAIVGCGPLTAAKIVAETAGADRFRSAAAYARLTGTAPLPVWSGNEDRHRLSRSGNRQLNAALHRIAITQARCHPGARALLARRRAAGDSAAGAYRVLKRRLNDVVYRALIADQQQELSRAA